MNYHFVDRVLFLDAEGEGRIETLKTFPRTEDCLDDTFRDISVVPPSLLLETLAFSGALLLMARYGYRILALLLKVEEARFLKTVKVYDRVFARSRFTGVQGEVPGAVGVAKCVGEVLVDREIVAEARVLFLCVPLAAVVGPHGRLPFSRLLERLPVPPTSLPEGGLP